MLPHKSNNIEYIKYSTSIHTVVVPVIILFVTTETKKLKNV